MHIVILISPIPNHSIIMKYFLSFCITLSILLIATVVVVAQPGLPETPSQAPVDGGLGFLVAVGGFYAWKKLKVYEE